LLTRTFRLLTKILVVSCLKNPVSMWQ